MYAWALKGLARAYLKKKKRASLLFIDARVRICFRVSPFFFFRSPSLFPFSSYSQLGGITTVPTTPQQAHNNNKKGGFAKENVHCVAKATKDAA